MTMSPPTSRDAIRTVLGIDPGLARAGVALGERQGSTLRYLLHEVIRSKASEPLEERLARIFRRVRAVVELHGPDEAAIEKVYVGKNVRSALSLGHARAAAILAVAVEGLTVGEYAASQVKRAVGAGGHGGKEQVGRLVHLLVKDIPGLLPEDAADAAAVAICHFHRQGTRAVQ